MEPRLTIEFDAPLVMKDEEDHDRPKNFILGHIDCHPFPTFPDPYQIPHIPKDSRGRSLLENIQDDYPDIIFETEGKSIVSYALPGESFWSYKIRERFKTFKEGKPDKFGNKSNNIRAKTNHIMWQNEWIVVADIDKLDSNQRDWCLEAGKNRRRALGLSPHYMEDTKAGYQCLAEILQEELGDKAYVFCTPSSGRPKVLFNMRYPEAVKRPKRSDASDLIKHYLPEYVLKGCIDLNATFNFFINVPLREEVMIAIRGISATDIVAIKEEAALNETSEDDFGEIKPKNENFKYNIAKRLPLPLKKVKGSKGYIQFLHMLVSLNKLTNRDGFCISQNVVARTLGVDQRTASYYIKKAKKDKLLAVKNEVFVPEKIAKAYIAVGRLRKAINSSCKESFNTFKLPTIISKGDWHRTFKEVIGKFFFQKPMEFLTWVRTIPGSHIGDRIYQSERICKYHIKHI